MSRLLLFICGLGLLAVLFVPMWRIYLQAPQYPEGLRLLIFANKLAGNVDIINGLNHYIGMKTLHANDFVEFKVLPGIIVFFAALFIIAAIAAKRRWMNILCILFVAFGVFAMVDFWRWEYAYGHDLNPDAAIIVPGMAYQPPLIGFKQLLNFGAYSVPDMGGWLFVSVGALLLFCTIMTWRFSRKNIRKNRSTAALLSFFLLISLASCSSGPQPIRTGTDNCYYCKMTISDERFGAEIVTKKGKIYKFDDTHCILSYLKMTAKEPASVKDIYLTNFCGDHRLINVHNSSLLKSDELRSPMGGNIAAFDNRDSLLKIQQHYHGEIADWNLLVKQ